MDAAVFHRRVGRRGVLYQSRHPTTRREPPPSFEADGLWPDAGGMYLKGLGLGVHDSRLDGRSCGLEIVDAGTSVRGGDGGDRVDDREFGTSVDDSELVDHGARVDGWGDHGARVDGWGDHGARVDGWGDIPHADLTKPIKSKQDAHGSTGASSNALSDSTCIVAASMMSG
ncbi:hypothetical protein PF004_g25724 [Phytophthora fragariae]|uniref:Uncharacterized protein n=1 Tax=Phytophthora fragariae TaxID=53985 RepID=A0A6G0MQG4_9STRA|nr:hypothetical protein PF004_g25724 [Phytophthora fragariae]